MQKKRALCFSIFATNGFATCVGRVARIGLVSIIFAMANAASAALFGYYGLNETGTLVGQQAADSSPSALNPGTYIATVGPGPTSIASVNAGLYGTAVHFDSASSQYYIEIFPTGPI